jgi:putative PIG3 family NAD(P)H quinone oxidoreductase
LECSGIVAELGRGVTSWQVGDPVAALLQGGAYAEYAVADAACLLPVASALTLRDAGAAPESAATVWSNLTEVGYVAGAPLLVHGGAGGIGTMAITLGSALQSPVFATAGTAERVQACEQLGASRGINHKTEDFVQVVLDGTDGRGVDVILDVVGAAYVERNLAALAEGGTLAIIGLIGGAQAELDLGQMLRRRHRLMASNLRNRSSEDRAAIVHRVRHDIWELVCSGRASPVIGARFPMARAEAAHAAMLSGSVIGKILLTWD